MTIAITVERLPLDVLHHEVGQTVLSSAAVEQATDVRVIERRKDLSFFTKPAEDEVSVHPALDQLDRRCFIKLVIGARRFVHRAHTTASDFSLNSISAEAAPDHRIF